MLMIRRPMPMIGLRMHVDQWDDKHPHREPEEKGACLQGFPEHWRLRGEPNHDGKLPCALRGVNPTGCPSRSYEKDAAE
jgi:hypothetical protein